MQLAEGKQASLIISAHYLNDALLVAVLVQSKQDRCLVGTVKVLIPYRCAHANVAVAV